MRWFTNNHSLPFLVKMELDRIDYSIITPAEARLLQERYKGLVRAESHIDPSAIRIVAGTDISYLREEQLAIGVATVFTFPELEPLEEKASIAQVNFPYIPGLLSFREIPALLPAIKSLESSPQLFLVDGQGIAHPRSFGLACHLGILLNRPTIGCAKSRLLGFSEEPGSQRGSWSFLLHDGAVIGAVLRTRTGVKPLYISVGHLVTLQESIEIVLACTRRFRIPEPQRCAHQLTARLKSVFREGGMPELKRAVEKINYPCR
jgi:deoxyribonuclease V